MIKSHRAKALSFAILVAVLVPLLAVSIGPALASALSTNLGNLRLTGEWQAYDQSRPLPRCQRIYEVSQSRAWFERALEMRRQAPGAMLGLGRAAWLEGKCAEAADLWQTIAHTSRGVVARWELWNASYADGLESAALAGYQSVGVAPYFFRRGIQAESMGQSEVARDAYELSVAIRPDRDAVQALARLYVTVEEAPAKAQNLWLSFAGGLDESNPDHWWALAQAAELNQQWAEALDLYDQAIELQPNLYLRYLWRLQAGAASLRLPDYHRGKTYLEQALAFRPQDLITWLRLGELEQAQGHFEAAIEAYREAEALHPENDLPLYYQGLAYRQSGDTERARELFLRAKTLNPNNASVYFYLGLQAYEAGNIDGAIQSLEQAVALQTDGSSGWTELLVQWYAQGKRCPQALETVDSLLRSRPDNARMTELAHRIRQVCP